MFRLCAQHLGRTEKLESMTAADALALGQEFTAQTVDKLQHAGDLWLLNADDASTLMDAVMESFRIQDQLVSVATSRGAVTLRGLHCPGYLYDGLLLWPSLHHASLRLFALSTPTGAPPPVRVLDRAARPHDS